jgi:mannose-6-phosphate isomerase-like protein (cupin superfamily)
MAHPGKILYDPRSGVRLEVRKTARDTLGKGFEVEILYPPGRGKEDQQPHFHTSFDEWFEVLSGKATYWTNGIEHTVGLGGRFAIPRNIPHLNPYNAGSDELRLRQWIELEQTDRKTLEGFEDFLETGFGLATEGRRAGFWQTMVLLKSLQPSSYAAGLPVFLQRTLLGLLAGVGRMLGYQSRYARFASPEPAPRQNLAHEYHFYDRWYLLAPIEQVWESIVQTEQYSRWWGRVYDKVEKLEEGDQNGVGARTRVKVHGPLPYRLGFMVESVCAERPYVLVVKTKGDLVGTGVWRLRSVEGGTEVGYDWRPRAEFPLVRLLSPLLKPLFRYNHDWCMRQGEIGLREWFAGAHRMKSARA